MAEEQFDEFPDRHDDFHQIVLFHSDYDGPMHLTGLVAESWNSAVLDCGANKTVCGRKWFNTFVESLTGPERFNIKTTTGTYPYKFGDGAIAMSTGSVILPAILGGQKVGISTDIVEKDIPLLLSREAMKKARMSINFKNDTAQVFNTQVHLNITKSGHYTVPLTPHTHLLNMLNTNQKPNIVLTLQNQMSKRDQAVKIHQQFAHAPAEKLIKLTQSAGKPWNEDKELEKELHQAQKFCGTCQVYAKAAARPVVGLPNANKFLETVAMDLKFYDSKTLLHLIDHATRLSTCVRIPSKKPEHIVKAIFSNWISVYGTTEKFLTDNGGEFVNEEFNDMCERRSTSLTKTRWLLYQGSPLSDTAM